jgi:ribosomal protein S18 acetylase RimI-like enzyme
MRGPQDAEPVSAVFLEAFRDHQGDLPFTPDFVRHVLQADDARPDLSHLAYDAEGPVGAILCRDRPSHGYVWVLGVLRRGRRRGLGRALLTHAFADFAADGRTSVALEVEAQSLTGATRVYERAGMTVRAVHDTWTRPLRRRG